MIIISIIFFLFMYNIFYLYFPCEVLSLIKMNMEYNYFSLVRMASFLSFIRNNLRKVQDNIKQYILTV